MRARHFLALLLLIVTCKALAIDELDIATYRVFSVKNEPTLKVFRLVG